MGLYSLFNRGIISNNIKYLYTIALFKSKQICKHIKILIL